MEAQQHKDERNRRLSVSLKASGFQKTRCRRWLAISCLFVGRFQALDHGVVFDVQGLQVCVFGFGCRGDYGIGQTDAVSLDAIPRSEEHTSELQSH